jgi:UPF0042 nucleotide-binding protein
MRFLIVTGMSGAGKSSVLNMLEDSGYYCVDNLPVPLIEGFAKIAGQNPAEYNQVAIGMDIRNGTSLEEAEQVFERLGALDLKVEILFLDASDETLIKRYKETRRTHPLAGNGRIENGIEEERRRIAFLRDKADYVIDTSRLLVRELKAQIEEIFFNGGNFKNFMVTVLSFGYKYGIPADADLVLDVRFLPNPFYVPELKHLTGENAPVHDYVMASDKAKEFLKKLVDMVEFLIPNYIDEGKNGLVIAIGCTGGHHRSVTLAIELTKALQASGYSVKKDHRDINR